ncbi:MAG: hypothetical protein HY466_07200 [Deltaproteobacteria bacterium]|nr:hypothetical protein [Deltaproteobacteria bacterium]
MKRFWFLPGSLCCLLLLCQCGSLDDSDLTGSNVSINLQVQNPDSTAKGVSKGVDITDGTPVSKALPSSVNITECTLTGSGAGTCDAKTVAVPSGSATVTATLHCPTSGAYTITAECLDSSCASNSVSCGYKGSASTTLSGGDSVSISAKFLNLASRSSGDVRYVRVRQDSSTQLKIVAGFGAVLTDAQKATGECNIEIDSSLSATSPTTVNASRRDGLVSGTKGKPYFKIGPGLTSPKCHQYNTGDTKELSGTGSWSTDADGNTTMECVIGVRQAEAIASGRNAFFAAACTKDGTNWVAIPSSGMAEYKTSAGGDGDVAALVANGSTCSIARNGETCSSGFCEGSASGSADDGECVSLTAATLAADVTDFAGDGTAGTTNGSSTAARFSSSVGACVTPDGRRAFVADTANHQIRHINLTLASTNDSFVTLFAGNSSGNSGSANGACTSAATFNEPLFCVVNKNNDTLYVTEGGNHTIRKISMTDGTCDSVSTLAGTGSTGFVNGTGTAASFSTPAGIVIDADGNLYVADRSNHAIRKITSAGVVTTLAGTGSAGSVNGTGTVASFSSPQGLAIERSGTSIYVADDGNSLIRLVVTATGAVTTFQGVTSPLGLVIDPNDANLYATSGHDVSKIVISTGTASTVAGTGAAGSTNGNGTNASFSSPRGLFFSRNGNVLYVLDVGNNKLRQIQ